MDKPLVWLHGKVKTPPFSGKARIEAGSLLRRLQTGEGIGMPESRPMPTIGRHCYELRIEDGPVKWRIIYRIDPDAIVIAAILKKKGPRTPKRVLGTSKQRFRGYDDACR